MRGILYQSAPLLVILLVVLDIFSTTNTLFVLSRTYEDYFLSRCECDADSYHHPRCDFSALSKDKLRILVEKLMETKIVCIKSYDRFYSPSFTTSFASPVSEGLIDAVNSGTGRIEKDVDLKGEVKVDDKVKGKDTVKGKGKESSTGRGKSKNSTLVLPTIVPTALPELGSGCIMDGLSCSLKGYGIEYLFPTTLMTNSIIIDQQSQQFNQQLKELLLDMEEEDDGCKFNLHGGYRSKDGFLSRTEPAVKWLKSQILPRVQTLLSLSNSTHIQYTVDGWGAVLRSGHGQNVHVHPGSMFAGVYYVAAPKEIDQQPAGKSYGCIRFLDPRMGAAQAQVVRGKNIYGDAVEICPPENGGLLILFPSWVMHQVIPMPDKYKGPRIAISFNVIFQP